MTPVRLDLAGYRGDAFLLDVPLEKLGPGGARVPITVEEAEALRDTYTLIRMYVRVDGESGPVLKASRAEMELFIDPNYQLPDGTAAPQLCFRISSSKTGLVIEDGRYDVEFDFPNSLGPYTKLRGSFSLTEDVTYDDPV